MKMIIGSNVAENCDTALVLNGLEVFRLREGGDGAWLCDFEVADSAGHRLAKIVKNQIVHAAPGFTYKSSPEGGLLFDAEGKIVASALWRDKALVVTGRFFNDGVFAVATEDELIVNGISSKRNRVYGSGSAVVITQDGMGLGSK